MSTFVRVALPLPLLQSFVYAHQGPTPPAGTRVLVPFQRGLQVGWVLGEGDPSGIGRVRSVLDVLEASPSVSDDLLRLALWISEYYVTSPGIAIRAMLPPVLSDGGAEVLRITEEGR